MSTAGKRLAVLALCWGALGAQSPAVRDWEQKIIEADHLMGQGSYAEAGAAFWNAIAEADRAGIQGHQLATALNNLALIYQDLGKAVTGGSASVRRR